MTHSPNSFIHEYKKKLNDDDGDGRTDCDDKFNRRHKDGQNIMK